MKYLLYFSVITIVFFTSCINDNFSVGDNLVSPVARNILIDTSTVELYTGLSDSAVTSGLSRMFMGRYIASDFGTITAESYLMFSNPTYSSSDFGSEATVKVKLDSISLILKYDDFHYGDTTQVQTINLYKLKKIIELDDKSQLYNTSSVPADANPWVSYRFKRPTELSANDSLLEVRLPDEFGLELIRMMQAQSDTLDSEENFQRYFKGLRLSSGDTDNATINAFELDESYPVIRLYYHTYGVSSVEKSMDIKASATTAFSNIKQDRSGTLLAPLSLKNQYISSAETENKLYLQGLTGLYIKLRFPYINNLLKMGNFVKISTAYLYVYPVQGTYNAFTPLPANLALNYLDENGKPMELYVDGTTTSVQTGTLQEDKIYNKNTYYIFDISDYIESELGKFGVNSTTLQLQLSDTDKANTLKSLVVGDSKHAANRIKLVIYFVVYDK